MFDVRVLNHYGVWSTDLVTGSQHRAQDRARFLMPRVPAVQCIDRYGKRVDL
jgi:hypothetical protein